MKVTESNSAKESGSTKNSRKDFGSQFVKHSKHKKVTSCASSATTSDATTAGATAAATAAENVINKTNYRLCSILDKAAVDDNENTSSDDNTLVAGVNDCCKPNSPQEGNNVNCDVNCNDTAAADSAAPVNRIRQSGADNGYQDIQDLHGHGAGLIQEIVNQKEVDQDK